MDDKTGTPTQPLHITPHTWQESHKKLEEYIRDDKPFEGKFQTYLSNYTMLIPTELRDLFDGGGVLTVSTEKHLLLFGAPHWLRMQRILSKEVGLSPVNNELARHIYSHMYRFDKLNDDGSINMPIELVQYAGLTKEVAMIGLIYYAEIHNKQKFVDSEKNDEINGKLARFKKIRFNEVVI
jgi:DNA-binding transcriptional regulator/RsmH inhibitor MraZ